MADAAVVANTSKEAAGVDGGGADPAGGGIAEAGAGGCGESAGRPKWLCSCMRLAWICAMAASVQVILSASVAWEAANEAVVVENVRTVSMRARKSLAERVMYCGGGAEVLGPAIFDRAVGKGPEVSGVVEGIGA